MFTNNQYIKISCYRLDTVINELAQIEFPVHMYVHIHANHS